MLKSFQMATIVPSLAIRMEQVQNENASASSGQEVNSSIAALEEITIEKGSETFEVRGAEEANVNQSSFMKTEV